MTLPTQRDLLPQAFLPVLTAARIRETPEDFRVEEIPAYDPCGSGDHLFLRLEKRNIAAGRLIQILSQMTGIHSRDVGVAGQKDRHAVTIQQVSVPHQAATRLTSKIDRTLCIHSVTPHTNKLRTGHLQGNRFCIILRPVESQRFGLLEIEQVRERLTQLEADGFPNYFGPQRFGKDGNTVRQGLALLDPDQTTPNWPRHQRRYMKKMVVSAVQSEIFNRVLAERVRQKTFRTGQAGDVVCRRRGSRPFSFDDRGSTAAEDCVPMGPIPGAKMNPSAGAVARHEDTVYDSLGLPPDAFRQHKKLAPGTRRAMVAWPADTSVTPTDDGGIACHFTLPPGCYATVLLAQVCGTLNDGSRPQPH